MDYKNFKTPVFRASFVNLYTPKAMTGPDGKLGAPKYGLTAVFDRAKFTPAEQLLWDELIAEMDRVTRERFGYGLRDAPQNFKRGIRKCSEKRDHKTGAIPKGFDIPDGLFVSLMANVDFKPGVVDRNGNNIGPEFGNGHMAYSGAYMRASVRPFTYPKPGASPGISPGISLGLQNVQVVGDGEPLGGAQIPAADDFSDTAIETDTSKFISGGPAAAASSQHIDDPLDDDEIPF